MPNAKFTMLGKSKFVHVVRTKAQDLKKKGGSECQQVRKYQVANSVPKGKGLSPEAASALDPCEACRTADVLKPLLKKPSREDRRAVADEVRERAAGKKPKRGIAADMEHKAKKVAAKKSETGDKPSKERKPSLTKSGPRSVVSGVEDAAKAKAEMLAAFGDEHGWDSRLDKDKDTGHWVLTSRKGAEIITTYFIDGKYDVARHAEIKVGNWTGKLRGAHAVRRQMSMEGRDRPHPEPGKGRTGPRKKEEVDEVPADESPEDARRRVPFLMDDDPVNIIDAVKGKTIKWRNGVSNAVEEAWLPAEANGKKREKIRIVEHPKTGKRMLEFLSVASVGEHGEVYGPERSVYLDRIIRVVG